MVPGRGSVQEKQMRSGRPYALIVITALALLTTTAKTTATVAQPASPISGDPSACSVQPRSFDDIAALVDTPPDATRVAVRDGDPADAEAVREITAVVTEAVACANANDIWRSLALFTDAYVSERFGPGNPDDLGGLEATTSRTPVAAPVEDRLTLVDISDVTIENDDSATATVTTQSRTGEYVDRLTFAWVDGTWKIDSWSEIASNPATPTA